MAAATAAATAAANGALCFTYFKSRAQPQPASQPANHALLPFPYSLERSLDWIGFQRRQQGMQPAKTKCKTSISSRTRLEEEEEEEGIMNEQSKQPFVSLRSFSQSANRQSRLPSFSRPVLLVKHFLLATDWSLQAGRTLLAL